MPTSNTHTLTSDLGFPHPLYLYYTTGKGVCQEFFLRDFCSTFVDWVSVAPCPPDTTYYSRFLGKCKW